MGQLGLFDLQNRMEKLNEKDKLLRLSSRIDWSIFKGGLKKAMEKDRKSQAGRPPFDIEKMFRVLVLQRLYNLSDGEMEFQLRDRLSFCRFCGFGTEERTPDEKTIWYYRELLTETKTIRKLFDRFDHYLREHGMEAKGGQIIDASFVEVPKQRNNREENEEIKNSKTPESWQNQPAKARQKDCDARWTKKNDESYYGYKNHINVDVKRKIIRDYSVTDASVHDSQELKTLLDPWNSGQGVWADSAYKSEEIEEHLREMMHTSHINHKGYRNHPLSEFQIEQNRNRSSIRARVEHVFGFMANTMKSSVIRGIGMARAEAKIGLMNLVYNLCRFEQVRRGCCA